MENVVPGVLQRLHAADIIRMVGLVAASVGQEFQRSGTVSQMQRRGARLIGRVDPPSTTQPFLLLRESKSEAVIDNESSLQSTQKGCSVEVEPESASSWMSKCSCSPESKTLCVHAAALLYQWLASPESFSSFTDDQSGDPKLVDRQRENRHTTGELSDSSSSAKTTGESSSVSPLYRQRSVSALSPQGNLLTILSQLSLSELRGIAREYALTTNGMARQQLAEMVLETLQQSEAVRRVAATLEKSQRQLLAALTLVGGAIADDDLRGLFERFSLGQPAQLQSTMVALQGKALLFRTNLTHPGQPRSGSGTLSGSLLDIGWFVPLEVRAALRVSVPVTPFDVTRADEQGNVPTLQLARQDVLGADLLLVARALDGYQAAPEEVWYQYRGSAAAPEPIPYARTLGLRSTDGSVPIPPPLDQPAEAVIALLQKKLKRMPAFFRFAVRLLRQADLLQHSDTRPSSLHPLPAAAAALLGPAHGSILRDLFDLWLTRSTYEELFGIREDGVRLRCRATALSQPVLRTGELEAENSEARQTIVALLAQAPLNTWIHFSAFARFVYRLNPLFLQRRQRLYSAPHWWLEIEEGRPLRPTNQHDWSRAEYYYLSRLLSGPLHWWGACDLAYTPDGRLLAFRLTPLAHELFNNLVAGEDAVSTDYSQPVQSLEGVSTEEVLIAPSPQAWSTIELLEQFSEPAGIQQERLCYRLTPKALGAALSRGQQPTELLELLREQLQHEDEQSRPLAALIAQLQRWIKNYGRVRIYSGVILLETADSQVMREVTATTSLSEHIVQTIHPTLLLLRPGTTERLLDEFKRRGQSPLLHNEDVYGPE